jgi:hypothetical protein
MNYGEAREKTLEVVKDVKKRYLQTLLTERNKIKKGYYSSIFQYKKDKNAK